MRRGEYTFDPDVVGGLEGVLSYVGLHISNCIIAFLFVMVVIGLTTFPLFWPLFWIMIWNNFFNILFIIIAAIVSGILVGIAMSYIIRDDHVYNRR